MKTSNLFLPTSKETERDTNSKGLEYLSRGGFVHQTGSGLYSFTPLGFRVRQNIQELIRTEMNKTGAQEIWLPTLQPASLWSETGRWKIYENEMFTLKDHNNKDFCLNPTAEEAVVDMVRSRHLSHKDLSFNLYQFSSKFRDETIRAGLLRTREFLMKDAYSFHDTHEALDSTYQNMRSAYIKIFEALELDFKVIDADPGEMGGGGSEEFLAISDIGDSRVYSCKTSDCKFGVFPEDAEKQNIEDCPDCSDELKENKGIEIGHIFKLGDRYTKDMGLTYRTKEDIEKNVIMGCYGIGVNRVMQTVAEQHNDHQGLSWPKTVAPFNYIIIPTNMKKEAIIELAERVYEHLGKNDVLFDDRAHITAGQKFAEANLIGIPKKIILGPRSIANQQVEIEHRSGRKDFITIDDFFSK